MTALRIGTRGSELAMSQTRQIVEELKKKTGHEVEIISFTTQGDRSKESLASLGGTGVFAAELRKALLNGECDAVVHSLKDLPTAVLPGLTIGAIPKRADARDALCARDGLTIDTLPEGARVGTGSPRRQAQLKARRPDIEIVDIRGNVDTRLGRVASGDLDAVILAVAGLTRLGRTEHITEILELSEWPTAPGQGALALEVRTGDEKLVSAVDHKPTRIMVEAERGVLAHLEAGCSAPIGAQAMIEDGMLFVSARVYRPDGSGHLTSSHALYVADSADPAGEVSVRIGDELLADGAGEIVPLGGRS
ncbi:hydroxymethylbilane synthase [Diaminobutyricimonas sp. LJ205]|uniref:hydroxymethylbilane synthase n=1 Tax=Diaminobutyricimonas sp. LJ205 TaxID=2683590 RepID=UPI0012F4D1F1|nr:hydroxymethylbilane synthase [Diaminobutyricimonas sp. LJ205]